MNLAPHIKDLLTACENDLKDPRSDKIAVRRTRESLQHAFYSSQHHFPENQPNTLTEPQNVPNIPVAGRTAQCTCTVVKGQIVAKDKDCPVHP